MISLTTSSQIVLFEQLWSLIRRHPVLRTTFDNTLETATVMAYDDFEARFGGAFGLSAAATPAMDSVSSVEVYLGNKVFGTYGWGAGEKPSRL